MGWGAGAVGGGGGGGAGDGGEGGGHWSSADWAAHSLFMLGVLFFFFCFDFVVGGFCGELNDAINCCVVWWNYTIRTHVSAWIYIYIHISPPPCLLFMATSVEGGKMKIVGHDESFNIVTPFLVLIIKAGISSCS